MSWYALYTRPRHEKRVHEQLIEKRVESFLPLTRELRQWKDRRQWVEVPLFQGYVFVNIQLQNRLTALQTSGVVRMVGFGGVPSMIPDWQIEQLRRVLDETERIEPEDYVRVGDMVEILNGPLAGIKGVLREKRGETRVSILLDGIQQSASFVVDRANIRPLNSEMPAI